MNEKDYIESLFSDIQSGEYRPSLAEEDFLREIESKHNIYGYISAEEKRKLLQIHRKVFE